MAYWLVVVPAEQHDAERLYYHDELEWSGERDDQLNEGDEVVLAAGDPLVAFGLGRVTRRGADAAGDGAASKPGDHPAGVTIRYTHRMLDDPLPLTGVSGAVGRPVPLDDRAYKEIAEQASDQHAVTAPRRTWLVSVDLPIEATSPAEAVRQFWSYVRQLGPRELPAFVWPSHDELAMQAYVLGQETNLDPEEEDDE